MDQSLRTVATQLLNSTNSKRDDIIRISDAKLETLDTPMHVVHVSTRVDDAIPASHHEEEENTTKMKFGIPVNSKFGHFEMSNPGHAMAITEEELEREMAAGTPPQKMHPTPPSMLSTWIQLNPYTPPSPTTEGNPESEVKDEIQNNQIPTTTSTKLPSSTFKPSPANVKPIKKTEIKSTAAPVEKTTEPAPAPTMKEFKAPSTSETPEYSNVNPTLPTTMFGNNIEEMETTMERKSHKTTIEALTTAKPTPSQKKPATKVSTTPKPRVTTPKNSSGKPSKAPNKNKTPTTRRPNLSKNDTVTSTSRIEKVTLRPMSTFHSQSTERPQFITKIKASVLTDVQKTTTTAAPATTKSINAILSKANFTEFSGNKIPNPTRVNNVLKVHTKKPIDDSTKIEIQPIRVNPPVLTIQKFSDVSLDNRDDEEDILKNSKIEVKFDFKDAEIKNPTTETATSTTTKRPRTSSKRKKNKNRRRKVPTSTTLSPSSSSSDDDSTTINNLDLTGTSMTGLQESKIEPESKVSPSKKKKNQNQNTQVQKPFGGIYNFLSRDVMPSVGVMSLVGLGLGLASYFLYPFGSVIARRNYDVEPNYKYNLDEYGGNYGLSEEEVLTKVYSGMTPGQHHQTKYGPAPTGDKNPNYYKYSSVDQSQPITRFPPVTNKNQKNRVIYRPVETTAYDTSYQKSDYKYQDIVTTTQNYYQRQPPQPPTDFVSAMSKPAAGNNRQFVVGNVPKEYTSSEVDKMPDVMGIQAKMDQTIPYHANENFNLPIQAGESSNPSMQVNDNFNIQTQSNDNYESPMQPSEMFNPQIDTAQSSSNLGPAFEPLGSPAALISKVDEEHAPIFEQAEITSISGSVEHGPRSLKFDEKLPLVTEKLNRKKRSILPKFAIDIAIPMFKSKRSERSSVIQVIPSKAEIEKEKKELEDEEDLSNEILDIIDDTLPGHEEEKRKRHKEREHMHEQAASMTKDAMHTQG